MNYLPINQNILDNHKQIVERITVIYINASLIHT